MLFLKRLFNRKNESTSPELEIKQSTEFVHTPPESPDKINKLNDLGTSQSICPYCNQALDPKPKRKKNCPHCNGTIYVSKGKLLTEEGKFIDVWVNRLDEHGVTPGQFQIERQRLSKQFGFQASLNDTVWRILNTLVTKDAEKAYDLMATLAREENKIPTPYLAESAKHRLLNYKKDGMKKVTVRTCNDDFVCPSCRAIEGKVFSIDQALRDMPIPHMCTSDYGCRCFYLPLL